MVDQGFTIAEDLPPGVQLLIPPFKHRGTGQLPKEQLEYSENKFSGPDSHRASNAGNKRTPYSRD